MNKNLKKLTLSALFLAIGIVLPLFTMQIKEIGDTLLPMHIPVLLCGILCGGQYGFAVGLMLPFIRSFIFSMPPLYPNAVWMAAELATYGLVVGILYNKLKIKGIAKTYVSLLIAMLSGRIVWGIAKTLLLFGTAKTFTLAAFISGGFVDALPGIILQLLLIPLLVKIIDGDGKKMKTVAFHYGKGKVEHTFNSKELIAVLESSINGYKPALDESGLVEQAMKNPVGSKTLCELARSNDGIGGDHFYHQLADEADINKTMEIFMSRGRGETVPDQWQTQVLLRVLKKASVIYISEMEAETVEKMHMLPAKSIGEALEKAKELLGKKEPGIVAIPDGISVIVKE